MFLSTCRNASLSSVTVALIVSFVLVIKKKKWFPTWENEHEINLRHKKKYIEFGAKTNRLYNSPLHYMGREWRPFVISASRSLDLVDLHGVGRSDWYHQGPVKGRGSTSYHPIPLARPRS